MTFDSSINQPPWLPCCLAEIEARSEKMTPWEMMFIRSVRPRIKMSLHLTEKQIDTLRKIRFRLYMPEPKRKLDAQKR